LSNQFHSSVDLFFFLKKKNVIFDPRAQLPPKTAVHVAVCLDARPCGTTPGGTEPSSELAEYLYYEYLFVELQRLLAFHEQRRPAGGFLFRAWQEKRKDLQESAFKVQVLMRSVACHPVLPSGRFLTMAFR
jgi:hypothetical protein